MDCRTPYGYLLGLLITLLTVIDCYDPHRLVLFQKDSEWKTNLKLKSSDDSVSLELSATAKWAVISEKPYRVGLIVSIKYPNATELEIQPQNVHVSLLQTMLPLYDQKVLTEEGEFIVYCDFTCKECVENSRGYILSPKEHGIPAKIVLSDFLLRAGEPVVFDTINALLPKVGKLAAMQTE